jgi:hypothetical protein
LFKPILLISQPFHPLPRKNLYKPIKSTIMSVLMRPFNIHLAISWWESDNNDCKPGHFNVGLYLAILKAKYEI